MSSNKIFRVAVFGLSGHEQRILQTICILSKNRSRIYVLEKAVASSAADLAVVDGDDPRSVASWHTFQARNPTVPAVMVGSPPASESGQFRIGRPIMATLLYAVLDRMHELTERPANAVAEVDDTAPVRSSRLKALVVDSSLPIRRQMVLELARFVGQVDLAEDSAQALRLLVAKRYDIVFLEVVLPGMDGYQICRLIKRNKKTKDTPVIMLTKKSSSFDRVRGKFAGCDTYMAKPVDQTKFYNVVKSYLKHGGHGSPKGGNIPGQAILESV